MQRNGKLSNSRIMGSSKELHRAEKHHYGRLQNEGTNPMFLWGRRRRERERGGHHSCNFRLKKMETENRNNSGDTVQFLPNAQISDHQLLQVRISPGEYRTRMRRRTWACRPAKPQAQSGPVAPVLRVDASTITAGSVECGTTPT